MVVEEVLPALSKGPATKAKAAKKLGYTDDFGNLNEWDGFTDDEYWMMTTDDDEYSDDE